MSQFHSTMSRRQFMKVLGLAGVGGAALLAPQFHDLDELTSSTGAQWKRPWWVKHREFEDPTIEIDWNLMQRFDGRNGAQAARTRAIYYGKDRVLNETTTGTKNTSDRMAAKMSGYTHKSRALELAFKRVAGTFGWAETTVPAPSQTPDQLGFPKWTGTQEEAGIMLRAAMRLYGAALVGYGELSQKLRDKVVFTYEKGTSTVNQYIEPAWPPPANVARPIVFETVDKAYETNSKLVIPTKELWEISLSTPGSNELFRFAPNQGLNNGNTFYNTANLHASTWNFLRMLGYQIIGTIGNDSNYMGSEASGAVLNGLAESSRNNLYSLMPETGAPGRLYNMATDLPVEPTKPIDAGMWRFCHSCKKCANACPPGVISKDNQPAWDIPSIDGKPMIFHRPGVKAFWSNLAGCRLYANEEGNACRTCWGACTFTVNSSALVHTVVKGTIATTGLFNSFLFNMAETFGYGNKDAEEVWDMSLPVLGQDSTRVSWTGGYRK